MPMEDMCQMVLTVGYNLTFLFVEKDKSVNKDGHFSLSFLVHKQSIKGMIRKCFFSFFKLKGLPLRVISLHYYKF